MNKTHIIFIAVVMFTVFTVSLTETLKLADASPSETKRLLCYGDNSPTVNIVLDQETLFDHTLTLEVSQDYGTCFYKGERSHVYEMSFIPIMFDITIVDKEFDYVVYEQRITGVIGDFSSTDVVYSDIEYCINVTSYWLTTNTVKHDTTECFTP